MERFLDKVAISAGGCWEWAAFRNADGYGRFNDGQRIVAAHRFAYERFVGEIPDGLQLDHLCRVRHCVNPDHLEPVTALENGLRGENPNFVAARTGTCRAGLHQMAAGRRGCTACYREYMRAYWQRPEVRDRHNAARQRARRAKAAVR